MCSSQRRGARTGLLIFTSCERNGKLNTLIGLHYEVIWLFSSNSAGMTWRRKKVEAKVKHLLKTKWAQTHKQNNKKSCFFSHQSPNTSATHWWAPVCMCMSVRSGEKGDGWSQSGVSHMDWISRCRCQRSQGKGLSPVNQSQVSAGLGSFPCEVRSA